MSIKITQKHLNTAHLDIGFIKRIALRNNIIALINDRDEVYVLDIDTEQPRLILRRKFDGQPNLIALSPSTRFVLVARRLKNLAVWNLQEDTLIANLPHQAATFAQCVGMETLIVSSKVSSAMSKLQAYRLSVMYPLFSIDFPCSFMFMELYPTLMTDYDTFFVIGYPKGEGVDFLLKFSFEALHLNLNEFLKQFKCYMSPFHLDDGYPISVGLYQTDEVVVLRDHADTEDAAIADKVTSDVWAFRGLYIRRLSDNRLMQRIDYIPSMKLETGTPIFATDAYIVVVGAGQIEIISRTENEIKRIAGDSFGIDPENKQIVATEGENIKLISLS